MDQFVSMPTYWGDVQVCVNFKRLFQAMDMISEGLLSIAVVDPSYRNENRLGRSLDIPPRVQDIEQYTRSIAVVRKCILPDGPIRHNVAIGTAICLAVFDVS